MLSPVSCRLPINLVQSQIPVPNRFTLFLVVRSRNLINFRTQFLSKSFHVYFFKLFVPEFPLGILAYYQRVFLCYSNPYSSYILYSICRALTPSTCFCSYSKSINLLTLLPFSSIFLNNRSLLKSHYPTISLQVPVKRNHRIGLFSVHLQMLSCMSLRAIQ